MSVLLRLSIANCFRNLPSREEPNPDIDEGLKKALRQAALLWNSTAPRGKKDRAWKKLLKAHPQIAPEFIEYIIGELKKDSWYCSNTDREQLEDLVFYQIINSPTIVEGFIKNKLEVKRPPK